MGTKDKLIEKLKRQPVDFTFEEATRLLQAFGYVISEKGRTSGSRVMFSKSGIKPVLLHRPHPQKEMKQYAIKQLLEELIKNGDIEL